MNPLDDLMKEYSKAWHDPKPTEPTPPAVVTPSIVAARTTAMFKEAGGDVSKIEVKVSFDESTKTMVVGFIEVETGKFILSGEELRRVLGLDS